MKIAWEPMLVCFLMALIMGETGNYFLGNQGIIVNRPDSEGFMALLNANDRHKKDAFSIDYVYYRLKAGRPVSGHEMFLYWSEYRVLSKEEKMKKAEKFGFDRRQIPDPNSYVASYENVRFKPGSIDTSISQAMTKRLDALGISVRVAKTLLDGEKVSTTNWMIYLVNYHESFVSRSSIARNIGVNREDLVDPLDIDVKFRPVK